MIDRQVFAARRIERLGAFDTELEPVVAKALQKWKDGGRWYGPIVNKAEELWEETFGPDHSPTKYAIRSFRAGLVRTLKQTGDPALAENGQTDRITYWVSTYTVNHAEHLLARKFQYRLEWVTRHDDRVRETHREADGETIAPRGRFAVGGYKLRFPGDPVGPPSIWIHCRCIAKQVEETAVTAAAEEPTEAPTEVPFHGVAAPTDVPSGDGRQLAATGFSTRTLPLPFNYQPGSFHGGDAGPAQTVGRVDSITLAADGLVHYEGVYLTALPYAAEAQAMLESGAMRGVSVDLDSVIEDFSNMPEIDDSAELADVMDQMQRFVSVFSEWRIAGITQVAIPAFQEAFVALGPITAPVALPAPTPEAQALLASATMAPAVTVLTAAAGPALPGEWFQDPGLTAPTPFTVLPDGRVFGHVATFDTCHVAFGDYCRTAPHSATGYAYFKTGVVTTTAGEIPVGRITMGAGHADLRAGARTAAAHYDNVAFAAADVAAGEDTFGIWVAGALRPGVSEEQKRVLRNSPLSGDWREIRGNLEMVAALAVNVPGFPIPRTALAADAGQQLSLVAAGIVAGPGAFAAQNAASDPAATDDATGVTPDATAEPTVDTSPERIAKDLRAIDATVDTVVAFLNGIGDDALGPHGQQARDLAVAADDVVDQLLRDLGIPDPEDEAGQPGEPLTPAAVTAAALSTDMLRAELARREKVTAMRVVVAAAQRERKARRAARARQFLNGLR